MGFANDQAARAWCPAHMIARTYPCPYTWEMACVLILPMNRVAYALVNGTVPYVYDQKWPRTCTIKLRECKRMNYVM